MSGESQWVVREMNDKETVLIVLRKREKPTYLIACQMKISTQKRTFLTYIDKGELPKSVDDAPNISRWRDAFDGSE